jgi:hypothetical protein
MTIHAQNSPFQSKETTVPAFIPNLRLEAGDMGGQVLHQPKAEYLWET